LENQQFLLQVESAGFNDGNTSVFSVNDDIFGENGRGHNIVILNELNLEVLATGTFDTHLAASEAEALADFIAGANDGNIIMAAIRDEGSSAMTERAYLAFESVGSTLARSVGDRDSWSLIGRKGGAASSGKETLQPNGTGRAVVSDTLYRLSGFGSITSPEIGPALAWRTVQFEFDSPAGTRLAFDVLAKHHKTGRLDTLKHALAGIAVDISDIDHHVYRSIQLVANFESFDGQNTPVLRSWGVDFDPVGELLLGRGSLSIEKDTVLTGDPVNLKIRTGNFGLADIDSFAIDLTVTNDRNETVYSAQVLSPGIKTDSYQEFDVLIPTEGVAGEMLLTATVDARDDVPELLENNNIASTRFWATVDTVQPQVEIKFDGRRVVNGDFVSGQPDVTVEIRDRARIAVADTSLVTVLLDGERVVYGPQTGQAQLIPVSDDKDAELRAIALMKPSLEDGEHRLEVIARDVSRNFQYAQVEVVVNNEFSLTNVMNYPNPFANSTEFTYILTRPAIDVRLKVYTVAGRLINEIFGLPGESGFNTFRWSHQDYDGDGLANGVYFYKLVASDGREHAEVLEKFAILR
jgi:hypothetical protein